MLWNGIASQLLQIYECSAINLTWNSFKRPNISMIISFCGKMVVLDTKHRLRVRPANKLLHTWSGKCRAADQSLNQGWCKCRWPQEDEKHRTHQQAAPPPWPQRGPSQGTWSEGMRTSLPGQCCKKFPVNVQRIKNEELINHSREYYWECRPRALPFRRSWPGLTPPL